MSAVAAAVVKAVRIAVLKPFDIGTVGIALSITILSAVYVYAGKDAQNRVFIEGPQERWIFSLDHTETIAVSGPLGDTIVELRDRQIRVLASPCDNQTCVTAGSIRTHGQWIACLPNHVLVSIDSEKKQDEPDAAAW
jgi:hypothetical protein